MSDDDLIRRGDALAAVQLGDTVTKMQARILAITHVDADPVCTGCGGTGMTYQTERRCACMGPDLSDPIAVHANMLRGTIAKPTVEQIIHLYGRDAFQPMIDAAVAKALEDACLAVSEHADWPEDEHGRTEQAGLFARVINAICAIAPAAPHVNETPKSEHDAGNVLTVPDLVEAGKVLEGVTPGPWRVGPVDDCRVEDAKGNEVAQIDGDYNQPETWPLMEANARFIAWCREGVPALIALATAQAAQIAGLTKERDNLADKLELERALTDGAHRRAKAAEADAATLRAEVERLRGVAKSLEKAASEVSRRGAETGPQWSKLTIAILQARTALGGKHE